MSGGPLAARRGLVLAVAALWAASAAAKDAGGGWTEKNKEGKVVQELKIEAPSMTEEDQYGHVMPERYRCDSCRAVMFHLDTELRKKHPKSRRLKQWEYTDIFDHICRTGFEGYGIKLVNGENALSGPGLKAQEEMAPGSGAIQMGGETWSKRLGEICRKIVYEEVGEEDVYEKFYRSFRAEADGKEAAADDAGAGLTEALCMRELRMCHSGPKPPKAKDTGSEKKAAKADAKAAKKAEKAASKAAKKDKDAKAAAEARRAAEAKATPADSEERIDVQAFLRSLAVRHGLTSDEYLASRTKAEWEKQLVAIAGRIFNKAEL